jgi:hypothetical protein
MTARAVDRVLSFDLWQTQYVFALFAFLVNVGFSVVPFVMAKLKKSCKFSFYLQIYRVFLLALIYVP